MGLKYGHYCEVILKGHMKEKKCQLGPTSGGHAVRRKGSNLQLVEGSKYLKYVSESIVCITHFYMYLINYGCFNYPV